MQRSKTDLTATAALREYAARMPFVVWQPPAAEVLALRGIARRIAALVVERTRERNRLHAVRATKEQLAIVVNDIEVNIRHLERRIELLTAEAVAVSSAHEELHRAFERLTSVPGIATHSAVQLLPELLVLPDDMTVRQWVAHAGLDPRACQSGTSVDKPARISKVGNAHIRRALFMPALVAVRHDPPVKAFFAKLVTRGKSPSSLCRRRTKAAPRSTGCSRQRRPSSRRSSMLPLDNGEYLTPEMWPRPPTRRFW
jgi:transposase